ncbi:uncharacterized protein LOC62_03G004012 [Vanrija pseudolonga]|uniref:Uncharacterized protein n=1 Tax=Vanrija pseudolonga TaxID=143232 RepID=A0AAF1BK11_9TREE|nr:hypothetical protein LOC62_03G004012 [Vanrija pseudolonga]
MRLLALLIAALALALTTTRAYYADFTSANATAFPIKEDHLNCRIGPATTFPALKQYRLTDTVRVVCQRRGMVIAQNYVWNLTPDGCYVADYYIATGIFGIWAPECNATSAGPPPGSPAGVATSPTVTLLSSPTPSAQ